MIQNPSKELTLIVYNTPKPPRYYKLNKALLKSLFTIIPILVITSISFSFLYSMFLKNKIVTLRSSEPIRIQALKTKTKELNTQLLSLKKTNSILTKKLSRGSAVETSISSLGLFTIPTGINDLRNKELIRIEDVKIKVDNKKIRLHFNLANNSPEHQKLSGYISVIQIQGSIMQFYPTHELAAKTLRLEYTEGESFGFSRFRPTIASFQKLSNTSAKYKVFIFSKTGDLLAYKQLGPKNIE